MDMQARFAMRQAVVFTLVAAVLVALMVYVLVPVASFWVHFIADYFYYVDHLMDVGSARSARI